MEAATTAAGRASFLSAAPGGPLPLGPGAQSTELWPWQSRPQSCGGFAALDSLLQRQLPALFQLREQAQPPKAQDKCKLLQLCFLFFVLKSTAVNCRRAPSPESALCAGHVAAQKNRSLAPSKHPSSFQGTGQMRQGKAFHLPKRVRAELCQLDCILLAVSSLPISMGQPSVVSAPRCDTNTSGVRGETIRVCSMQHPGDIPQVVTFVLAGTPGFLPYLCDTAFSLNRFPSGLKRYLSLLLLPNAFLLSSLQFKSNSFFFYFYLDKVL